MEIESNENLDVEAKAVAESNLADNLKILGLLLFSHSLLRQLEISSAASKTAEKVILIAIILASVFVIVDGIRYSKKSASDSNTTDIKETK